jgi:hypothetical protein
MGGAGPSIASLPDVKPMRRDRRRPGRLAEHFELKPDAHPAGGGPSSTTPPPATRLEAAALPVGHCLSLIVQLDDEESPPPPRPERLPLRLLPGTRGRRLYPANGPPRCRRCARVSSASRAGESGSSPGCAVSARARARCSDGSRSRCDESVQQPAGAGFTGLPLRPCR